jgi:hypothetical protein
MVEQDLSFQTMGILADQEHQADQAALEEDSVEAAVEATMATMQASAMDGKVEADQAAHQERQAANQVEAAMVERVNMVEKDMAKVMRSRSGGLLHPHGHQVVA